MNWFLPPIVVPSSPMTKLTRIGQLSCVIALISGQLGQPGCTSWRQVAEVKRCNLFKPTCNMCGLINPDPVQYILYCIEYSHKSIVSAHILADMQKEIALHQCFIGCSFMYVWYLINYLLCLNKCILILLFWRYILLL